MVEQFAYICVYKCAGKQWCVHVKSYWAVGELLSPSNGMKKNNNHLELSLHIKTKVVCK